MPVVGAGEERDLLVEAERVNEAVQFEIVHGHRP